ncbi:PKD-like family lipoprotein [Arachidicoccus sp.]|uniref:PKD-like family lipoprotein n=1 Tax=Arachidicoccus sp. TaxID=1872624 RepID=UPI003D198065
MKYRHTLRYSAFFAAIFFVLVVMNSCYKDKGNYTYRPVPSPVVSNLDSVYNVFIGDSLVIAPIINIPGTADSSLSYMWTIQVPPDLDPNDTDVIYHTKDIRIVFGLGPKEYGVKLTVSNGANGMKYFYNIKVYGKTGFSSGSTVLTDDNGTTKLSFIKSNDSVQPDIFEAVNPGVALPGNPTQILAIPQAYQPPIVSYWVFGKTGANTGVQIDANTFKKMRNFSDNFFSAPDTTLDPELMFVDPLGVISGNVNGVLYNGTTSTYFLAPTYGMFGGGAVGDYKLSPEIAFNFTGTYGPGNYIGFDLKTRAFVRFNLYGDANYFGTQYDVKGTDFDPKNVGMDLIHIQQINGGECFAYFKSEKDSLYELEFNADFNGSIKVPINITTEGNRLFAKPELINADTKWTATQNGIIYFTYQDKIYRYNPLNLDFKTLTTDFGGKQVTMIKLMDQNTLVAGVDGSIYYLDISTGNIGTKIKEIDGLPGKVIDIAFRAQ